VATVSLQDLIAHVATSLRDCIEGSVTTGGTSTFRDTARSTEKDDRFNGSEVFFRVPEYGGGATQPFVVTDFAKTNGIFTLNAGGTIDTNDRYVMLNIAGRGYPYKEIVRALTLALDSLRPTTVETDESSLPYVLDTFEYTIPATFKTIERVWVLREMEYGDSTRTFRIPLPWRPTTGYHARSHGWEVLPGTRTLLIHGTPEEEDIICFSGEQVVTLPTDLDDEIDVPLEAVVNAAVEYLQRGGDQKEQGIAAGQYVDRTRTVPVYRRPNSIALP
jgi:hypothetical protein